MIDGQQKMPMVDHVNLVVAAKNVELDHQLIVVQLVRSDLKCQTIAVRHQIINPETDRIHLRKTTKTDHHIPEIKDVEYHQKNKIVKIDKDHHHCHQNV